MSPSQTIGPFFNYALTADEKLGNLNGVEGERITLRMRLLDGDGAPVPDGMLELWQADASGIYQDAWGFGRLQTDQNGICLFETVRPGPVGEQSAHINVTVFARGLLGHLQTRVYFADDPSDLVLSRVPADRRATLIAQQDAGQPAQWNLDIHLQGEHETVFFDF